jgi:hypothetical protein
MICTTNARGSERELEEACACTCRRYCGPRLWRYTFPLRFDLPAAGFGSALPSDRLGARDVEVESDEARVVGFPKKYTGFRIRRRLGAALSIRASRRKVTGPSAPANTMFTHEWLREDDSNYRARTRRPFVGARPRRSKFLVMGLWVCTRRKWICLPYHILQYKLALSSTHNKKEPL